MSLLANAIMVPLSNLSLAIGFFQIVIGTFSGFLSSAIASANLILLKFQLFTVNVLASFKFSYIGFYRFNTLNTIAYFIILFVLFTAKKHTIKLRILISCLVIIVLFVVNLDYDRKLRVSFLYVRQGDCTLLETPDGSTILIDCGTKEFTYNSGESTILPYLKRRGIEKIDLLILTHPHNDHIGGIEPILKNFTVKKILFNGSNEENRLTEIMDKLIIENKIPVEKISGGDFIEGYGNLKLYFLNPPPNDTLQTSEHTKSIVMKLKYRNSEFLFLSDLSTGGEEMILDTYGSFLKSDVLKVSHHGSKNASSIPFILACRPECAVISCGKDNVFGHPSEMVLTKFSLLGSKILRTDRDGAIIFESDGNKPELINWK